MSYPSNAMVSLPGSYRKPSLIPVSPTNLQQVVERERFFLSSDPKQPPLEITDCSYGYGFIWFVTKQILYDVDVHIQ